MVDQVLQLLARSELFVDLAVAPLAEADKVKIYTDEIFARLKPASEPGRKKEVRATHLVLENGQKIVFDGKPMTIAMVGADKVWLKDETEKLSSFFREEITELVASSVIKGGDLVDVRNTEIDRILKNYSPVEQQRALAKQELIKPFLAGSSARPTSTEYRLLRDYRQAEEVFGCGLLGMFDNRKDRGNRNEKLPQDTIELVDKYIKERYLEKRQQTKKAVYGAYRLKCKDEGVIPASYKWFANRIKKKFTKHEIILAREGRRAAYQASINHREGEGYTGPVHGDRPFELAHIDHTTLDIRLVDHETYQDFEKPILTVMKDAYSKRVLAHFVSFSAPSYINTMMVLRDCVRRYGRMPQSIITDRGKEFGSTYYEALLALFEVIKLDRPPAQARFGALLERFFRTLNTQFLYNLQGNTQIMKKVRQVTKKFNPENNSIWPLKDFNEYLEEFLYEVYETMCHGELGQSPRDAFEAGLAKHGYRPQKLIPYDDAFILATLPSTKKGDAKVNPVTGIKVENILYWHPCFQQPDVAEKGRRGNRTQQRDA